MHKYVRHLSEVNGATVLLGEDNLVYKEKKKRKRKEEEKKKPKSRRQAMERGNHRGCALTAVVYVYISNEILVYKNVLSFVN